MKNTRYKKASSRIVQRRKKRHYASLVLKIGLPIIFLIGVIFILRADFLQVESFDVLGTETVKSESIKNIAINFTSGNYFFLIPKSNILFLNKEKLVNTLLSEFPRLEKVKIGKQFFNNIVELKVIERSADFLWCSLEDKCFLMDKNGLVFEKAEILGNRLVFRGILEGSPVMQNFATTEKIQNYLKLIEHFRTANVDVLSINIESSDKAIANTTMGEIFFSPNESDLSLIAQNVVLLINETKSKNPTAKFQYIDARFGNKMFYKLY